MFKWCCNCSSEPSENKSTWHGNLTSILRRAQISLLVCNFSVLYGHPLTYHTGWTFRKKQQPNISGHFRRGFPNALPKLSSIKALKYVSMASFRFSRLDEQLDGSWLVFSANVSKRNPPKKWEGASNTGSYPSTWQGTDSSSATLQSHAGSYSLASGLQRELQGKNKFRFPGIFTPKKLLKFKMQMQVFSLCIWWDWSWIYFINYVFCRNGWQMLQSAVSRCWMAEWNHGH